MKLLMNFEVYFYSLVMDIIGSEGVVEIIRLKFGNGNEN